MGQRGPKPLPSNVHRLRGNPSKLTAADLGAGVNPEIEIPNCPRHLLREAKIEWRRIAPQLEKLGLISKLDRAELALYCQSWARWVWCEEQLQLSMAAAAAARDVWEADEANKGKAWAGGDGFMIPTPNGSFTYSPHWVGANKAMDQVNKFKSEFGMSPSSRGRVSPSSNQLPLPGMPDPKDGFNSL